MMLATLLTGRTGSNRRNLVRKAAVDGYGLIDLHERFTEHCFTHAPRLEQSTQRKDEQKG